MVALNATVLYLFLNPQYIHLTLNSIMYVLKCVLNFPIWAEPGTAAAILLTSPPPRSRSSREKQSKLDYRVSRTWGSVLIYHHWSKVAFGERQDSLIN